jgi:hypothetical protein
MKTCCNNKCNNQFDTLGIMCPQCREKKESKWKKVEPIIFKQKEESDFKVFEPIALTNKPTE